MTRNAVSGGQRRSFSSAVRDEWIGLRTLRSTWVLSGLVVLCQVVATVWDIVSGVSGDARFSSDLYLMTLFTWIFVAAIGANAFGAEYRHRTIATAVLTMRSRSRVVLAKAVVVAGIGALTSLLAVLVNYLGVLVFCYPAVDPFRGAVAGSGVVLYVTLCGLAGLALAGLTRSAAVALGVLIVWPTVLEQLVIGHVDAGMLPFFAAWGLAGVSPDYRWSQALPLVVLTAVLLAGAVAAVSRRDV